MTRTIAYPMTTSVPDAEYESRAACVRHQVAGLSSDSLAHGIFQNRQKCLANREESLNRGPEETSAELIMLQKPVHALLRKLLDAIKTFALNGAFLAALPESRSYGLECLSEQRYQSESARFISIEVYARSIRIGSGTKICRSLD